MSDNLFKRWKRELFLLRYNSGGRNPTRQTLTYGGTVNMDVSADKWADIELTGNVATFNLTNLTEGDAGLIFVKQGGAGSYTIGWGSAILPTGGLALSTVVNSITVVGYVYSNGNLFLSKETYGVVSGGGSSYDSDALAYFTEVENQAGTITSPHKDAYNTYVTTLKSNNIYAKIYAQYMYAGGNLNGAKVNAKSPLVYGITWSGSPTVSAMGMVPDGIDDVGDTGWSPDLAVPADGLMAGFYGRNNDTNDITMGCRYNDGNGLYLWPSDGAVNGYASGGKGFFSLANQNTTKFHIGGTFGADTLYYRDGALISSAAHNGNTSFSTETVKVLGASHNATINHSGVGVGLSIITKGLSAGEVTILTNAINTLMTAWGRNV